MMVAITVATFLIVAGIIGAMLKPNADQLKPLEPQPGMGSDAHGHDSHH